MLICGPKRPPQHNFVSEPLTEGFNGPGFSFHLSHIYSSLSNCPHVSHPLCTWTFVYSNYIAAFTSHSGVKLIGKALNEKKKKSLVHTRVLEFLCLPPKRTANKLVWLWMKHFLNRLFLQEASVEITLLQFPPKYANITRFWALLVWHRVIIWVVKERPLSFNNLHRNLWCTQQSV